MSNDLWRREYNFYKSLRMCGLQWPLVERKGPKSHPYEIRYAHVEKIDCESCRKVLDQREKVRVLIQGW